MDWQPASNALLQFMEMDLARPVIEARYAKLPFYHDAYLIEARTIDGVEHVVLVQGDDGLQTCSLTGKGGEIKQANEIAGLKLTPELVADYVRFFCDHIAGKHGPYSIIESADGRTLDTGHKLRDMRVKVRLHAAENSFRVAAYQIYADTLFRVSLRVGLDGSVVMLRDLRLGEFVGTTH